MDTEQGTGGPNKTAIKAGAAAIIAILLGFLWQSGVFTRPEPKSEEPTKLAAVEPVAEKPAEPAVEKQAAEQTPAEPEKTAVKEPEAAPEPIQPSFDTSYITPDGQTLVAGRGEPGSKVRVLIGGAVVAEAEVGADGSFTALFSIAETAAASLMSLQMVLPDGTVVASAQSIAVPPIVASAASAGEAEAPAPVLVTENGVKVLEEPAIEEPVTAPEQPQTLEAQGTADQVAKEETKEASVGGDAAPVVAEANDAQTTVSTQDAAATAPKTEDVVVAQRGTTEAAEAPKAEPEPAKVAAVEAKPAAPAKPAAQVVLQAIGYSPAGDVMLSGRGEPGQVIRIYLDNAPLTEVTVGADGVWQMTVADIAPGVFTLRGDQIDPDGKVTARFETPFKRETREALAALVAPVPEPVQQTVSAPEAKPAVPTLSADATVKAESAEPPKADATAEAPAKTAGDVPQTTAQVEAPAAQSSPAAEPAPAASVEAAAPETVVAGSPAQPDQGGASPSLPVGGVSVTVQPGYTLWAIARDTYGDGLLYVQVYKANKDKIRDPDLIYPGQVFVIPKE